MLCQRWWNIPKKLKIFLIFHLILLFLHSSYRQEKLNLINKQANDSENFSWQLAAACLFECGC